MANLKARDLEQWVRGAIAPFLAASTAYPNGQIQTITNHIRGGWEGWLQVETALYVVNTLSNMGATGCLAEREMPYPAPNASKLCDLRFVPDGTGFRGQAMYLELKVENMLSSDVLARFEQDIAKVIKVLATATTPAPVVVAAAFMINFSGPKLQQIINQYTSEPLGRHCAAWTWNSASAAWVVATEPPATATPTFAYFYG